MKRTTHFQLQTDRPGYSIGFCISEDGKILVRLDNDKYGNVFAYAESSVEELQLITDTLKVDQELLK